MLNTGYPLLACFVPVVLACALLAHSAQASPCATGITNSVDPALPAYRPQPIELPRKAGYVAPDGAITVIGYNDMREMLEATVSAFSTMHPDVRFRLDLPGTRFGPAALAKGLSAFAPMGALFTPPQLEEYRHLLIYLPRAITPLAREFVRFALSREGQQAVAASPQRYLPLSARDAALELAKLE